MGLPRGHADGQAVRVAQHPRRLRHGRAINDDPVMGRLVSAVQNGLHRDGLFAVQFQLHCRRLAVQVGVAGQPRDQALQCDQAAVDDGLSIQGQAADEHIRRVPAKRQGNIHPA